MAAMMILGVKTAMRALKSVEGMDKLGPAYLMPRERAVERENTLRMGLMLVFMEVVVGCIICFCAGAGKIYPHYYAQSLPLCRVGFAEKCDRSWGMVLIIFMKIWGKLLFKRRFA
jgi:hypothetical protein